ncbi:MAG: hypothetical protein JO202_03725 [Ktedonobacteraceae bacterium]|nr:hypothetical protein [Ktedonobacteraceae bacterium]
MATQTQAPASTRQFSEAEMKRYFSTVPSAAIVAAIIGVLLLFIGFSTQAQAFLASGLVLLLIGGGIISAKLIGPKPTDQQYDAWLNAQAQRVRVKAVEKLGLDPRQLTAEPLVIHGFVLSGTKDSISYRADEIRSKKGTDGKWRFSVNIYTYFFPEEHHLAAFVGDVNALNQSSHNEKTEEYFYRDVVGATTGDEQDTILYKKKQYQYRIQRFSLRIASGDSIGVSVNATPLDNRQNLPNYTIPDSGIDQTVANLRALLRSKKQGGV